jgi:hypothetical protein
MAIDVSVPSTVNDKIRVLTSVIVVNTEVNATKHVSLNTRKTREYCQWKIGLHMVHILY